MFSGKMNNMPMIRNDRAMAKVSLRSLSGNAIVKDCGQPHRFYGERASLWNGNNLRDGSNAPLLVIIDY